MAPFTPSSRPTRTKLKCRERHSLSLILTINSRKPKVGLSRSDSRCRKPHDSPSTQKTSPCSEPDCTTAINGIPLIEAESRWLTKTRSFVCSFFMLLLISSLQAFVKAHKNKVGCTFECASAAAVKSPALARDICRDVTSIVPDAGAGSSPIFVPDGPPAPSPLTSA